MQKVTPQEVAAASEIIEAGRKKLLNDQPNDATDINAGADWLQKRIKEQAVKNWKDDGARRGWF